MSDMRESQREFRQLLDGYQRSWLESIRPRPYRYRGRLTRKPRTHVTIRKPRPPGELPPLVQKVVAKWVEGQSYRWLAKMFEIDRETVHRWVVKHPHEIQRILNELGWYGAYTVSGLRRKAEAMRALGVIVTNPPSHRQRSGILRTG